MDASNILFQLVKNDDFEHETRLWEEVELVLNSENDPFRQRILKEYSDKQHRDLIASCAIKQKDISKNIALMLKLLGKILQRVVFIRISFFKFLEFSEHTEYLECPNWV